MLKVGTGVAHVKPNTYFLILVANLGKYPKTLENGQNIAVVAKHTSAMVETPISHAHVLGVAAESLYRKPH